LPSSSCSCVVRHPHPLSSAPRLCASSPPFPSATCPFRHLLSPPPFFFAIFFLCHLLSSPPSLSATCPFVSPPRRLPSSPHARSPLHLAASRCFRLISIAPDRVGPLVVFPAFLGYS
jgi:hypothetical protein